MKKWLLGVLVLTSLSAVAFRKSLLSQAVKAYFLYSSVNIDFVVTKFSFNEFELQNISLNNKNRITKLNFLLSLKKKYFLKKIELQISNLDVESLTEIGKKFGSNKKSNSKDGFSLQEMSSHCQDLTQILLNINIENVTIGDNQLRLNLQTATHPDQLSIHWQDLPKTRGSLLLRCQNSGIDLEAPHFQVNLKETHAFNSSIQDFSIDLSGSHIKWTPQSPIDLILAGKISTNILSNKTKYKISIPHFMISGKSTLPNLNHLEAQLEAKKVDIAGDYTLKADFVTIASTHKINDSFSSNGNFQVENFSLENTSKKKILTGLNFQSDFLVTTKDYKLKTTIRDKTKQIFIDDLKISKEIEKNTYNISFDKPKTQFRFNSQALELFPSLKEYLKTLSGKINFGAEIQWSDGKLFGFMDIVGSHLFSSTEFGDFEDLNIQHRIDSFENFSSPPLQRMRIKKVIIGPGIENVDISYKIENKDSIVVHKLFANFDKGLIYTDQFLIDTQQKRIKNFLAQIVDFDLEKVLSIGLKDTVRAIGKLHGHIGLSYKEKKPILRGLLVSPQNGWIQYRPGDRKQATSLSLSDGPMDILNNYLYDFQYEQLSLRIDTDEKYDMNMTLNTFGYNPGYLNGKPLKLNINLQQNLLAAMQSLMLTYDLPARIKEKFEKVEP